jgi:hypothetical protein
MNPYIGDIDIPERQLRMERTKSMSGFLYLEVDRKAVLWNLIRQRSYNS